MGNAAKISRTITHRWLKGFDRSGKSIVDLWHRLDDGESKNGHGDGIVYVGQKFGSWRRKTSV
jgi:hypothetical protein